MPSGPPISPLTRSFFTAWAFYDLLIGASDTLGTCLIDANKVARSSGMNGRINTVMQTCFFAIAGVLLVWPFTAPQPRPMDS